MANGQIGGQKQLVDQCEHTLSRKLHHLSACLSLSLSIYIYIYIYTYREREDHWSHLRTSSTNSRSVGSLSPLSPLHASHTIDSIPPKNSAGASDYSLQHVMISAPPPPKRGSLSSPPLCASLNTSRRPVGWDIQRPTSLHGASVIVATAEADKRSGLR